MRQLARQAVRVRLDCRRTAQPAPDVKPGGERRHAAKVQRAVRESCSDVRARDVEVAARQDGRDGAATKVTPSSNVEGVS